MKVPAKSLALGLSLALAPLVAFAQSSGVPSDMPPGRAGQGMMPMYGQMQGMMGDGAGMSGYGMPSQGMMGSSMPMRMMMVLADNDGDGALSLEEFQAAHARFFKAIDTDKSGKVTSEEMRAFMYGQPE